MKTKAKEKPNRVLKLKNSDGSVFKAYVNDLVKTPATKAEVQESVRQIEAQSKRQKP